MKVTLFIVAVFTSEEACVQATKIDIPGAEPVHYECVITQATAPETAPLPKVKP